MLVEMLLFAGYHHERWQKGLSRLGRPQVMTGEGLVIRSDGLGYYAWLRSLLIDGDWSFDNEFDEHNPVGDYVPPAARRTEQGRRSNPWSVGPACVWALTVVPGHLCIEALDHFLSGWPPDGYSLPYQLMVGTTTLVASFFGLVLLYGICRHFADPDRAALAASFLTLGSTIVYYSAIEVSMAHGVGTATLALLVWYWLKTLGSERWLRWGLVGLLVGAASLMRWQLAMFAILPAGEALWTQSRRHAPRAVTHGHSMRSRWRPLVCLALAGLAAAVALSPQFIAWRIVYGHWLASPFPTAHNWEHPAWGQILWAQDRGFFYWTPLTLLAVAGYFTSLGWFPRRRESVVDRSPDRATEEGCRRDGLAFGCHGFGTPNPCRGSELNTGSEYRTCGTGTRKLCCDVPLVLAPTLLVVAFLLQVYVLASLWGVELYLGSAYGLRQLTESTVALAPGLALLLARAPRRSFRVISIVSATLVLWNLILVSQYRYSLVPADAGADPATLFHNTLHLLSHKRFHLLTQVALGPVVLALIWWMIPQSDCPLHDERALSRRAA
jgi:Dolichyl-phosphate-mannose-protein mannosyltransferase